jgi:hypothetical protein
VREGAVVEGRALPSLQVGRRSRSINVVFSSYLEWTMDKVYKSRDSGFYTPSTVSKVKVKLSRNRLWRPIGL